MPSLPASIKRIRSKATEKRWRHHFPHHKSMWAFCCHGHQSFDPICLKTLCSLSPTPVMLHIKFDQDWPTGFRDIQVWKCGRRRTEDGPLVYYKLILWAFGSGELKTEIFWSSASRTWQPLILKKHINGPWKPKARNQTRPSFYACPGYQHGASMETAFSHYKSMGNFLDLKGS